MKTKWIGISGLLFWLVFILMNSCGLERLYKSPKPEFDRIDQAIGSTHVPASLKISQDGFRYKNKYTKKERFVPWLAVIKWKSEYLGHGNPGTISEKYDYYSIRFYVSYYTISEKRREPTLKDYFWLSFRTCCTKAKGEMLIKEIKKYLP